MGERATSAGLERGQIASCANRGCGYIHIVVLDELTIEPKKLTIENVIGMEKG